MDNEMQRALASHRLPFVNRLTIQGLIASEIRDHKRSDGRIISGFWVKTVTHHPLNRRGEPREDHHYCVAEGGLSTYTRTALRKDDYVFVEGALRTSRQHLDAGVSRVFSEIVIDRLTPLDLPLPSDNSFAVSLRKLARLKTYVTDNDRVCPQPGWDHLAELILHKTGKRPPVPLTGQTELSDDDSKIKRLEEQLEFAWEHGALDAVDRHLRSLHEDSWYHRYQWQAAETL